MSQVHITGWKHAFNKVAATHAIRATNVVDLAQAKSMIDAVMAGNNVTLQLPDDDSAAQLATELNRHGAFAYWQQ